MTLGHNIPTYNLLAGSALAAMVLFVAADYILPKPNPRVIKQKHERDLTKLRRDSAAKKEEFTAKSKAVEKRVWTGQEDKASPALMSSLEKIATARGVKINSFRPQKIQAIGELRQLGFTLAVEGSFSQVMNMAADIEKTQSKAAITQLQITSSDSLTDTVKANVGISAFAPVPDEPASSSRTRRIASND